MSKHLAPSRKAAILPKNAKDMAQSKTADQVKQEHIDKMGADLGTLYNSLYNEVLWIHLKWTEFKELFCEKESRITLMNKSAPLFFFVVQKILWENILLGIARITDPAVTIKKRNASLQSIPDFMEDNDCKLKIIEQIKVILAESEYCRDWRNRHIAHKDYLLAVGKNAGPLKEASRLHVEKSLQTIFLLLNTLENEYFQSTTIFELSNHKGAKSLLYVLRDGLEADKKLLSRLKSGDFDESDIREEI